EPGDGVGNLRGRAVPLHWEGPNPDLRGRRAPIEDLEHVADRGAGAAGDQDEAAREAWQLLLAAWIGVPPGRQFLLQLTERQFERTDALGLDFLDLQLVFAARHVDDEAALRDHLQAVLQVEAQPQGDPA